jgi:cell division protein FtsB
MVIMSFPAYVKHIGLAILFLLATVNFTRTTLDVLESSQRLDEIRTEVTLLGDDKIALEEELEYKKSVDFVEKEARNKLGFVKPGEEVFVPSEILGTRSYSTFGGKTAEVNVFRLWLELIL